MAKPHTFQTFYDDLKTVSISFLARHDYLKPNRWVSGTITWSRNGKQTGSIKIKVSTQPDSPCLEFDYQCNGRPINYKVQLVSAPSNLGKGVVWYFICPQTGKRCRKLYLADTYFYHRSAFKNCMYQIQALSKETRQWEKNFSYLYVSDIIREQLNKKHFKKTYAGKPTKKYLKLTQRLNRIESIPFHEIERALQG